MSLEQAAIYPINISYGSLSDKWEDSTFIKFQDIIENTSPDTHANLQKPQSEPAVTDDGLLLHDVLELKELKEIFEKECLRIHDETFPTMKGRFQVYETVGKGIVVNHNTTIQQTLSNHPWNYTGLFVVRVPPNLKPGEGDVVFLDPKPVSDVNDQFGLTVEKGNIAVFPSWLKYRFRPLTLEQGTYDTVMYIMMHTMIVHKTLDSHVAEEREKWMEEMGTPNEMQSLDVDDVDQLGPSNTNPDETDIGLM